MSEKDVEILKKKMDQVLFYLHNDEGTGEKGLVAKVNDLQKIVFEFKKQYETDKAIKKATLGVIGAIGGFIGAGLLWIAEQIIKHIHLL